MYDKALPVCAVHEMHEECGILGKEKLHKTKEILRSFEILSNNIKIYTIRNNCSEAVSVFI